jgi:mannose PTS system EIIA component
MSTGILIVAHAPLATALRDCVLHVYPDAAAAISVVDVPPHESPDQTLAHARHLLQALGTADTLVLTDVFGATPCNIAQKLIDGVHSKLVAGVNLPMLLRTVNYRHESLDLLVTRAVAGGTQCIMQVAVTAPQNQSRKQHDHHHHDYQQ